MKKPRRLVKRTKIYSFDRVRYCSDEKVLPLREIIASRDITNYFAEKLDIGVITGGGTYYYNSYFSGRPENGDCFFSILHKSLANVDLSLTYIEIAEDTLYNNEAEVLNAYDVYKNLLFTRFMRDVVYIPDHRDRLDSAFFSDKAVYYGKRGVFQLVMYPRYCKQTGSPALRREFRISGNARIRTKLGIKHEREIFNPKKLFFRLWKKYGRYGSLSMVKVQRLLILRKQPVTVKTIFDFKSFRASEKDRDLSSECSRYRKRVRYPITYYCE